ncbi:MAG: GAF domain-containing protein [Anaerolineae bacterium]|nr:GAF domain-containing protein [Anaerolineae bacterium]
MYLSYLIPYLISLAISVAVGIFAYRRRSVPGATPFSVYVLTEASMTLGFILELLSPTLNGKVFWDNFQFFGTFAGPILFLAFAFQYTRRELTRPRLTWWTLSLLAAVFLIIVYTDPLHGLVRPEARLIPGTPVDVLSYDYTPTFWGFMVFIYGIIVYTFVVLFREFVAARHVYRAQIGTILIGALFSLAGVMVSLLEIEASLPRDVTSFGFAVGNLVMAWGLFRYRLFDLVPVARHVVVENMSDAVMVLDADRRIVDLNAAAARVLGHRALDVLGQPAEVVLGNWPDLIARFRDVQEGQAEITYTLAGEERYANLSISPLTDARNRPAGRILVARDVTERKRAELALAQTRDELERHVEERTAALHASAAALKRAQEVSHTGSWHIDVLTDQLTWSDEAYHIFGIPPGTPMTYPTFLQHIHPADRLTVDQAWNSALRHTPYDIEHRIVVDGEEKWVRERAEVEFDATDRAVAAIGTVQDITAQKQADANLRRYTEQLQLLFEISDGMIAAQSPRAIAQVALHYVRQLVPCLGVVIAVATPSDEHITFLAADVDEPVDLGRGFELTLEQQQTFSHVVERLQQNLCHIAELNPTRDPLSETLYAIGARAACHVPLLVHHELIGAMVIAVRDATTLTTDHLHTARRVAGQLALAVHQAQLHEQAQQHARDMEQRNRTLALLNEASRAFSSTLDQEHVFEVVLEEARRLLNIAAITIWLPDPDTGELVVRRAAGLHGDAMRGLRLPPGTGLAGWVAQHSESLIITDAQQDARHFPGVAESIGWVSRSILSVPLSFKGNVVGVLQAVHTEPNHFNADHLALLEPLAASAVIAIENARLFEEIGAAHEQLRALSRNLVDIQEAERASVARELHDEAGQSLSYLLLALGMMEREAGDPEAVIARARTLEGMIETLLENLHRLSVRLRPAALDHLGLIPALEQYIDTVINQYGIDARLAVVGLEEHRLPPEMETALYRVVQEALTNVARHAQASKVDVLLEQRGDRVVVVVEDNGVGFDTGVAQQKRLGLVGMRERAQMLGGTWTIESTPGRGTTMVVEVPHGDSNPGR